MKVTGARVVASWAIASGTFATMRSVGTTQMWEVREERECSAALACAGVEDDRAGLGDRERAGREHAVGGRERVAVEGWGVGEQLEALGCVRRWHALRDDQARGVVALAGCRHRRGDLAGVDPDDRGAVVGGSLGEAVDVSGRGVDVRGGAAAGSSVGTSASAVRIRVKISSRALTAPPVSEGLLRCREVAGLGPAGHRAR